MKKMTECYFPGDVVHVTPMPMYQKSIGMPGGGCYTPPPFDAKVLVVQDAVERKHCGYLICEGRIPQDAFGEHIQDALQASGLNPDILIQLVTEFDLPDAIRSIPVEDIWKHIPENSNRHAYTPFEDDARRRARRAMQTLYFKDLYGNKKEE